MSQRPSKRQLLGNARAASPQASASGEVSEVEAPRLVHELQVHQVELAQQNEELKAVRDELEASGQRYFDLYESAPVGLVTLNRCGIVREVNLYGRELLGDDDSGLAGACLLDRLVDPSRGELARALVAPAAETARRRVDVSVCTATADERILRAEMRPRPAADDDLLVALTDITEQRRSEADLAHTREVLELSNRVARIGYWQVDPDAGAVIWSAVAREIFDLPLAYEPTLAEILEFCNSGESRERLRGAHAAAAQRGETFDLELQITTPAGRDRWIRITGRADATRGGGRRLFGTVQDIDAHVLAETARVAQAGAEMANRSKTAFLARMSHDLRTPLNAVLGFSQLLQLNGAAMSLPDVKAQVQHIRDAGEHLLAMIDEVLDLTSIESGDLRIAVERVELDALTDDCMALVAPLAAGRAVTLHAAAPHGSTAVLGDHTRLRQVLMNLLSNAVKYNREGGSVEVDVRDDAQRAVIAVRDTGYGLSPEQVGQLFQPFNRLGAERRGIEGTGLGLVIAKQLVEAMGGTLEAQSTPGEGSVFTVHLERANEGGPRRSFDVGATNASGSGVAAGPFLVLYVEDNPVNVELMRAALALRPQVRLEVATDGEAGLAATRRLRPDLVLLDMGLPLMDGPHVFAHLRADPALARIPCVAVSANAMDTDIQRALDAGFTDYIVKPFTLPRMPDLLDRMMATVSRKEPAPLPGLV